MGIHVDTSWWWLRVYYNNGSKDPLLIDGFYPALLSSVTRSADEHIYFRRDWVGGPNLLIGLRNVSRYDVEDFARTLRTYVGEHPSCNIINPAAERIQLRALALAEERTADADVPLYANNSVRFCVEPLSPLLDSGELQNLIRVFLSNTSRWVCEWLIGVRNKQWKKNEITYRILIGMVWTGSPKHLRTQVSLASHVYGFLRAVDHGGNIERLLARQYCDANSSEVKRLLEKMLVECSNGSHLIPCFTDFMKALWEFAEQLSSGLSSGRLVAPRFRKVEAQSARDPDEEMYMQLMQLLDTNTVMRSWQIVVNVIYLVLNQLGVTPLERWSACYHIFRAVEDWTGEKVIDISASLAASKCVEEVISGAAFHRPKIIICQ